MNTLPSVTVPATVPATVSSSSSSSRATTTRSRHQYSITLCILSCMVLGLLSFHGQFVVLSSTSNNNKNDFYATARRTDILSSSTSSSSFQLEPKDLNIKGESLCVIIRDLESHYGYYYKEFRTLINNLAITAMNTNIEPFSNTNTNIIQQIHVFTAAAPSSSSSSKKTTTTTSSTDELSTTTDTSLFDKVSLISPSFARIAIHHIDLPDKPNRKALRDHRRKSQNNRRHRDLEQQKINKSIPYDITISLLQYILSNTTSSITSSDATTTTTNDDNNNTIHCDRFLITQNGYSYENDLLVHLNNWIHNDNNSNKQQQQDDDDQSSSLHNTDIIAFQSTSTQEEYSNDDDNNNNQNEISTMKTSSTTTTKIRSKKNKMIDNKQLEALVEKKSHFYNKQTADLGSVIIKRRVFDELCGNNNNINGSQLWFGTNNNNQQQQSNNNKKKKQNIIKEETSSSFSSDDDWLFFDNAIHCGATISKIPNNLVHKNE